ncbi:MAG: PKD domain-containing protein [Bacteroidota bacterium]
MRKCLFTLMLAFVCFSANAQSISVTQADNQHWHTLANDANATPGKNKLKIPFVNQGEKSAGSCEDDIAITGTSYDIFSNILNYQNQLIYNPDLNAMAFVHNQNDDQPGGAGFISYEYSLDGGDNWVTEHKPITPTLDLVGDGSIFGNGNRYPSGTIYNPPGNTDPANAYFVSVGTAFWTNPNGSGLGYEYVASSPLIYDGNDISERYYTDAPTHTFYRPSGLVAKADGTLWYVNTSWDFALDPNGTGPTSFRDFYVTRLTFNSMTKSFDREIIDTLEMDYTNVPVSAFKGEHNISFGPDGQHGYVTFTGGDAGQPQIQASPVIWYTSDGGNTWTKDVSLDYNQMPELLKNTLTLDGMVDTNNLVDKRPFMLEYDITVDADGNLHLFADMFSGSSFDPNFLNFGYFNGLGTSKLWHFIYLKNSGTWLSRLVKAWDNAPGDVGSILLRARPQAGSTPDGKKIFSIWSESPSGEFNVFPDTWGYGYDAETSRATLPKNLAEDAFGGVFGISRLPTLSPVTFQEGGGCGNRQYELPHVVSNGTYDPFDPSTHIYFAKTGFNENEFTQSVSFNPAADFTFTGGGFTVDFMDNSSGTPTSWQWDFGDGNTSTAQNPTNTYAIAGTYSVCLTVGNSFGNNGPVCMDVSVPFSPIADFSFDISDFVVDFTDLSVGNPDSWIWDFGDGNMSSLQNPVHTYVTNGNYTVCLISSNQAGNSAPVCKDFTIGVPPIADFSFQVDMLEVEFLDLTAGNPDTWMWDFGDGNTSNEQNPTHTYAFNGDYTVCLVSSEFGFSSPSVCKEVSAGIPPVADFSISINGLALALQDLSTNNPTEWMWTFGDGNFSTMQNPTYTYSTPGDYEICLVAFNDFGPSNTLCLMVTVGNLPVPDFSFSVDDFEVSFIDLTANNPTDWIWDFGDGNQSAAQNPVHTYMTNGIYTVCLTAGNLIGQSSPSCQDVVIAVLPVAQFSFDITDFTVVLTDLSTNQPSAWEWDFGDGNMSTEQNPTHVYGGLGDYTICLTAANAAGSNTSCQDISIITGSALEELGFGKLLVFPNPVAEHTFITTTKNSMPLESQVEIMDAQGKLVSITALNGAANGFNIDAKDWLPGLYFFSVKTEGNVIASGKLVKE